MILHLPPSRRRRLAGGLAVAALLGAVAVAAPRLARSQEGAIAPHWIWFPTENAEAETRYFRRSFNIKEAGSRLALDATADNRFVLYLDGKEIARGEDWHILKHAEAKLSIGDHVLAAEATNDDAGPAAFLVRGSIMPLGQGVPIHTPGAWLAAKAVPAGDAWTKPGFDESGWVKPADLGVLGTGPWSGVVAENGDASSRFKVPEGFKITAVGSPSVAGSVVAFTFDEQGAPCVSVERQTIYRLTDADKDGVYDDKVEIAPSMKNCQGLSFIKGDLWAVGDGPNGVGIYRLTDAQKDGVFEAATLVRATEGGMGEHGPHAITLGPDGCLYYNNGNHAHLKPPISPATSPAAIAYEGELLPHYNDSRGHAAGILAPCGEIYRSPDGGKTWERVVQGFRNQYDFAFNRDGEIFSFDSDMEWDIGLPWYRPVRVNHCPPGAELGSRNGSGAWPEYFVDSLPPTLNVGRGSPTGVTFYQGGRFPAGWDDNFLVCDWSQGRILAIELTPEGGSYRAKEKELVTGQPLNCTDIEVGPDGAVYFATGGRGTMGGLFKVENAAAKPAPAGAGTVFDAIAMPSQGSSYTRAKIAAIKAANEAQWTEMLTALASQPAGGGARIREGYRAKALDLLNLYGPAPSDALLAGLTKDANTAVRAKAVQLLGLRPGDAARGALTLALKDTDALVRRRACESLLRIGGTPPVKEVLPLLGDADRHVRYAARITLEHAGPAAQRAEILATKGVRGSIEGLLALARATKPTADEQDALLAREIALLQAPHQPEEELDILRLIGVTYMAGPRASGEVKGSATLAPILLKLYIENTAPERTSAILADQKSGRTNLAATADLHANLVREQARLLAYLDEPKAIPAILAHQAAPNLDHPTQIFDAYCLRAMKSGWTATTKARFWGWLDLASHWDGGFSYLGYLDFMGQDLLTNCTPEEKAALLADGAKFPFPTRVLVRALDLNADPARVADVAALYGKLGETSNPAAANELRALILDKLGQAQGDAAHAALRSLAAVDPARRDLVARALAGRPTADDLPILVEALNSRDANTTNTVLNALAKLDKNPEGPDALRNLILLSRRAGPPSLPGLNHLAAKWTGTPASGGDFPAALASWEKVYADRFPDGPPLTETATGVVSNYTLPQLLSTVVEAGLVKSGSPERGKGVITRAKCLECHKLGNEGQGLGPDLTTVSSRFRPQEVLESIALPSKVISDQYKSVQVAMKDGTVHNGMPAGGDAKTLVLLLSDSTKLNLPKDDIEEQAESKVSVMPEGLLNTLTPREIGDLLSLFEAQPKVEIPADAKK